MLNINDLEGRWLKYKLKSYMPHIFSLLSIIVLLILLQFTLFEKNKIDEGKNDVNRSILKNQNMLTNTKQTIQTKIIEKSTIIPPQETHKNIKPATKDEQKTFLSPSLKFINQIQEDSMHNYKLITVKSEPIPQVIPEPNKNISTKAIKQDIEQIPSPTIIVKPKASTPEIQKDYKINITRQTTHDDIDEVIKRFNKNNNPALSLFIAKKYYELGDYHKAYNYSLITNDISNDIEASWILFAKSLMKLNEEKMAKQTLQKYIKHSNSNRARLLLDEILSGKFQ